MSLAELNAAATGRSQPDRQAVLDALCLTLASGDGAQRCAAVIALGQVGQDSTLNKDAAVAAVVAALRDEDEDVRVDAAVALGRLADSTAVAPLLASLTGDPCTDVKAAAIDSLVRFDAREAIPVLRALVTSRGEDVVWDEEELLDWDGWLDIQIKAVAALAALAAEEAAPDLAAALTLDGGQEISAQVMPALAKMGEPGLEQLRACLGSDSALLRRRAAQVLPQFEDPAVAPLLTALLGSGFADLRALGARGWQDRANQPKILSSLAEDPDPEVRAAALKAVTTPSDRLLDRALKDADFSVAQVAVARLLADPTLRDLPHLPKRLLNLLTRAPGDQVAALAALLRQVAPAQAEMNLRLFLADRRLSPESRGALAAALAEGVNLAGAEVEANVTALIDQVDDGDRQVRFHALNALARLAGAALPESAFHAQAKARLALLWGLEGKLVAAPETPESADPDAEARADLPETALPELTAPELTPPESAVAESALAGLGSSESESLDPESPDPGSVQLDASGSKAAGEEPTPTSTSTLAAILANKGPDYAEEAAEDVELTAEDLERLALAAQRRTRRKKVPLEPEIALHEDVRRLSAQLLAGVASTEVAEALLAVLGSDDKDLRLIAVQSLAQVCERLPDLPKVVRLKAQVFAREGDRLVRLQALRILGASGSSAVIPTLKSLLADPDPALRLEVVRALGKTADDVRCLLPLLAEEDYNLRRVAAEVLVAKRCDVAVETILQRALDNDGFIAPQLAELFQQWQTDRATAFFLAVLAQRDRPRLWRCAVEALAKIWPPQPSPLLVFV